MVTCRNYTNSSNDNNNQFQDNLGCSAFTVCNLNSPFAPRDIKPPKIISFFFCDGEAEGLGLGWHSSRMHRRKTNTSDNLPQRLQSLWWSFAFNEVPSCQMNGLLAEWHEDMNQGHKTLTAVAGHYVYQYPTHALHNLNILKCWKTVDSERQIWNAISRSAVAVNRVCFTVWHLCKKLHIKVGKY